VRSWVETESPHFTARHAEEDLEHAVDVLDQLEATRADLAERLGALPENVEIVLHQSDDALAMARPSVPFRRALTSPASRRYLAGGISGSEIHMLSPPRLDERASAVPESRAMLMRTPSALYARMAVCAANPRLPPPNRVGAMIRAWRWAWLVSGMGAWLSGQTALARPAIARRLHESPPPEFPPGVRDAELLGGTVVDLLAREEGERAAIELVRALDPDGPRQALVHAFGGRSLEHSEAAWRTHLKHMAETVR
jgi:hypothetical protein